MPGRTRALLAFAGFGGFWGAWGAELPAIQSHAGVGDGALGLALLFIGAGALATMRPTGLLVDRFGARIMPLAFLAFAVSALGPALAGSALTLALAMLLLGASSGAVDVCANSEATRAERPGRPLVSLAHATFSAAVVASSLLVGLLRSAGSGPVTVLGIVAAALCLLAVAVARSRSAQAQPHAAPGPSGPRRSLLHVPRPLAILGALTALAFFVENAWQSWSAVQLEVTLDASPAVASLGPALFAAAAVVGRLGGHALATRVADRTVIGAGAMVAALGTLLGALAPEPGLALVGIALAGLGTSVCAPTLFSLAGRNVPAAEHGSAVSAVTTLGYLGFLVGPAAVGLAAGAADLPTALALVAGLAALLAVTARFAPVPVGRAGAGAAAN